MQCAIHHVTVVEAGPRLLVVSVHCRILSAVVVVFHAPHSGRPVNDILEFWDKLSKVLDKLRALNRDIVLLGDANIEYSLWELVSKLV